MLIFVVFALGGVALKFSLVSVTAQEVRKADCLAIVNNEGKVLSIYEEAYSLDKIKNWFSVSVYQGNSAVFRPRTAIEELSLPASMDTLGFKANKCPALTELPSVHTLDYILNHY